jgi:hypothetical protein
MTTQIPAQLPYIQNFETANDLGLLNGTQPNKWFYGSATGNTGKSIYITNDNGVTNAYTLLLQQPLYRPIGIFKFQQEPALPLSLLTGKHKVKVVMTI